MRNARTLLRVLFVGAVVGSFMVPASSAVASPSSVKSIQQQIDAQSNALEKIVEQYDGVNQQLTDDTATEAKLRKQIAPMLAAAQQAQSHVAQIAAQAYMAGPVTTLSALVASDSTQQMIYTMGALNEAASNAKHTVATYTKSIAGYTAQKQKLDDLIKIETAQRNSLNTQKTTINTKLAALYKLRKAAYGTATVKSSTGSSGSGTSKVTAPYIPGRGGKIVKFAYAQLGKPYAWAADGPGSYDCSGLVTAAYRSVGISVPHQSMEQYKASHRISRAELEPGDLVFYQRGDLHHVAIYIGNGKVIHAPTFGDVVKISTLTMMSTYGYGRIG